MAMLLPLLVLALQCLPSSLAQQCARSTGPFGDLRSAEVGWCGTGLSTEGYWAKGLHSALFTAACGGFPNLPWSWCYGSQEKELGSVRGCRIMGKIKVTGNNRMCNQYLLWAFDRGVGPEGGWWNREGGWNVMSKYSVIVKTSPSCRADLTYRLDCTKPEGEFAP